MEYRREWQPQWASEEWAIVLVLRRQRVPLRVRWQLLHKIGRSMAIRARLRMRLSRIIILIKVVKQVRRVRILAFKAKIMLN